MNTAANRKQAQERTSLEQQDLPAPPGSPQDFSVAMPDGTRRSVLRTDADGVPSELCPPTLNPDDLPIDEDFINQVSRELHDPVKGLDVEKLVNRKVATTWNQRAPITQNFQGAQGTAVPEPPVGMDDVERALQDAEKLGGKFDMQCRIGGMWYTALNAVDSKLARDYKAQGKKYSDQRAFRAKWVTDLIAEKQLARFSKQAQRSSHGERGTYKPFRVIVRDEGDDEAAVRACMNLVAKCVDFSNKGKLYYDQPLIRFNTFTLRHEFLHVTAGFDESFTKSWAEQVDQLPGVDDRETKSLGFAMPAPMGLRSPLQLEREVATPGVTPRVVPPIPLAGAPLTTPLPSPVPSPPQTPTPEKDKASKKNKKEKDKEAEQLEVEGLSDKDKAAIVEERRAFNDGWQTVNTMKPKLIDNTSSYHILVARIAEDVNWEWARGWDLTALKEKASTLVASMQGSDFWRAFSLLDLIELKRKFGKADRPSMVLEFRQLNQIQQNLNELGLSLKRLFLSQKARLDAEKLVGDTPKKPTRKKRKTGES